MKRPTIASFAIFVIVFTISTNLFSQSLPTETSTLFSGAGNCAVCHISGTGVFIGDNGADISPTTLWRSTMMANAARDPYWQAKVSAEVLKHPLLKSVIEDKCATCHMPMGRTEALYNGAEYFSFNEGVTDKLSMDGVSCTLCHQIQDSNLGTEDSYSGSYNITNEHSIFGPYLAPVAMPMTNISGYTPVFGEQVNKSELCATCHTLFTPYVNNEGQVAGYFPEQTPYLEWKNSIYPAESKECQTCHMPSTTESMLISVSPAWLTTKRTPIWHHNFVGGNAFVNGMINSHGSEIGVTASAEEFDSTLAKTLDLLQNRTIDLSTDVEIAGDTLFLDVAVTNLAGHKFPTGFPSRRGGCMY